MASLWPTIGSLFLGLLLARTAMAEETEISRGQAGPARTIAVPVDDSAGYALGEAKAGPSAAPQWPPDAPPPPPPAEKPKDEEKKEGEEKKEEEKPAEEGPKKLFHGPWLDDQHLDLRGFVDAGVGLNPASPLDRFNGPAAYDDRSNEFQLNQFYFTAERLTKVENECGEDYGYRADVLYGTDRRFIQTIAGTQWDSGWDTGSRFYGLCMPQLYGDLAYNKLLLRGGHFYAPCGYEVANADGNFFYSHTYGFLYGMPTTLTGGYAVYKVKDKFLVNGGVDTGWNEFSSLNGKVNGMFGFTWTSEKDEVAIISEWFVGDTEPAGIDGTRVECVTDITVKIGEKWHYVLENTVCHDSNTASTATPGPGVAAGPGTGPASWIGWTNYLFYDISEHWAFGFRWECFQDLDGAVVTRVGPPAILEPGSTYNDVTLGLNWKLNKNITLRSEARWDWAQNGAPAGSKPFDAGGSNGQFLWGNDIVVRF